MLGALKSVLIFLSFCTVLMAGIFIGYNHSRADRITVNGEAVNHSTRLKRLEVELRQLSGQFQQFAHASQLHIDKISENVNHTLARRIEALTETVEQLEHVSYVANSSKHQHASFSTNEINNHVLEQMKQMAHEQESHIDDMFDTELRDDIWADSMHIEIAEVFQKPELAGGQLADVDCRSKMCRVEVLHVTRDPADLFEFENHLLINVSTNFPNTYTRTTEGADGLRTVMLLVREGEQLPQANE